MSVGSKENSPITHATVTRIISPVTRETAVRSASPGTGTCGLRPRRVCQYHGVVMETKKKKNILSTMPPKPLGLSLMKNSLMLSNFG